MDTTSAHEIIRLTISTILWASAPVLAVALIVGLVIAFVQALTQIQEMTLTFVPKIVAIFVVVIITLPFIFSRLTFLSNRVFDLIVSGGI
ncbi:flagellar biosynthetic protein FliQ [Roseovarius indicus]|uniref:Flagellar biosynthesis protein FliQ n=1 Tax=Roseovarius indicus TaxID=540747 RepID=A0A0T5PC18_9RHOB|nr:flagellar biosynthetic protein FliQ [Roseovarius indicus]KRS18586.1 flagellar biosynthesis protein FliQ [Roseovarius indicus]OAN98651.1 flagellar biosynthetic protein FliQ [Roseovarius indicus]QEW25607.1 Flagellar biosynthetic protein FliQ [Roseovarius indicus]SFE02013.1 flagellar biosynthetic protein FliQ [Roseovarius indicus]